MKLPLKIKANLTVTVLDNNRNLRQVHLPVSLIRNDGISSKRKDQCPTSTNFFDYNKNETKKEVTQEMSGQKLPRFKQVVEDLEMAAMRSNLVEAYGISVLGKRKCKFDHKCTYDNKINTLKRLRVPESAEESVEKYNQSKS